MRRPKISVMLLGGTIVCSYDAQKKQATPNYGLSDLIERIPAIREKYELVEEEVLNIPGTQLTLKDGLKLSERLKTILAEPEIAGAVVIQGTDTLEEIAYLVSLVLDTQKPVVFTGSMKSYHEFYSDAEGNISGAIQTAGDPDAYGRGVMVYMNQLLFSAADVEKFHSNRVDAFQSFYGPIGSIENETVRFWRSPGRDRTFSIDHIEQGIPIIKSYAGMDDCLIRAAIAEGCRGIVIEGLGSGNVQPAIMSGIRQALEGRIPVLITTRCLNGATFGVYDYEGGGADLEACGAIFSHGLSSPKARIRLAVLLSAGIRPEQLNSYF